ncbi:MAG: SpoIID/LytB domain-containing protein [Endomicrobiia bacterium]|nr:SpoIID/LytB domain-containing protein [Endomicrobiia bacterium]
MPIRFAALIAGLFVFSSGASDFSTAAPARDIVRAGLLIRVESFNLSGDDYKLFEMRAPVEARFRKGNDYFVTALRGRIIIDGKSYSSPLRITPAASDDTVRINGKNYRDSIVVSADGGARMTVVNELGIDNYVRGVLAAEMSPDWPQEALKAQAVAARGFVWRNAGRHAKDGFDVCATVHCQVYIGASGERPSTDKAVFDTAGEILLDNNGAPANTVFHASCGGHTEEPSNVWDVASSPIAYLVARKCSYCDWYKHYTWSSQIEESFIRARLNAAGYKVGNIRALEITGRNVSGRARFIRVIHSGGALAIRAGKFRLAVDSWKMKSTKITAIVRKKDSFEFRGYGWGHGVGMCQAGAKGMADAGRTYRDILGFYYPGTYIKKISE